jgi:hypothetical protein
LRQRLKLTFAIPATLIASGFAMDKKLNPVANYTVGELKAIDLWSIN